MNELRSSLVATQNVRVRGVPEGDHGGVAAAAEFPGHEELAGVSTV